MSSIPPKSGLQPQGQSTSNQAASHASSPSLSGTSSPLPASTRSYANATKKSATDSTAAPATVGGSPHHGKSTSESPVSGKPMQQSQPSGVTIVNGAPAPAASQGDHSRKPSVTITSAGTSGYIPNGGPNSRPNSLQFGFAANQQTSPNMGNPAVLANQSQPGLAVTPNMNPRVTSPQTSPSPIPQPASSGGRPPPSSYQSQGNVPNFGSFGEAGDNVSLKISFGLSFCSHYFRHLFSFCYSLFGHCHFLPPFILHFPFVLSFVFILGKMGQTRGKKKGEPKGKISTRRSCPCLGIP